MSGILDIQFPGATADTVSANINVVNTNLNTGTPTPGSFIAINVADADTLTLQLEGTFVATLAIYGSLSNNRREQITGAINVNSGVSVSTVSNVGIYQIDVAGLNYIYLFCTSYTSGTVTATLSPTDNTGVVGIDSGLNITGIIPGTGATSLGKAEDAPAANGDTLTPGAGVRVNTTPVAQTSAVGDYGAFAIDQEGKQVVAIHAADELSWQSGVITLTTTTSTALKAAAGAGVRNYITDVDLANTSATAVRVDMLDGATLLRSFMVPAGNHISISFTNPLKGTANTAVNFQLGAAATDVRVSANGYLGM